MPHWGNGSEGYLDSPRLDKPDTAMDTNVMVVALLLNRGPKLIVILVEKAWVSELLVTILDPSRAVFITCVKVELPLMTILVLVAAILTKNQGRHSDNHSNREKEGIDGAFSHKQLPVSRQ
ncbi:hypothetical protein MGYG_05799 [Nannizzia gypsea CBS 118893]|uniref:Uncharacterized protein n=1 Tax=Arthroderma gypseum (strain ATCC MYA-4604 / CBS 118893) TaxID=535722 RepID=E4UXW7_ARTGP|nr:hypothetical protein MGYG_05799 [Nannizzia gypsea CBS 118893]EFR02799.1 hypothetical protein MGYG_05799 [Nannizzia gypsea CBS 118893]